MLVHRIPVHEIMPHMAVIFETFAELAYKPDLALDGKGLPSQYPKTVPASPEAAAMKESKANTAQNRKQTQGKPSLRVFKKILGTCPFTASPYSVRVETKRSAIPADHALIRRAALIIDGRTEIPEFFSQFISQ